MLSFAEFTLHTSFDVDGRISLACPFRFGVENTIADSPVCEMPLSQTDMLRVIGRSIESAECETDGTLHLRFSNGDCLIAYANDPSCEAYTLTLDGVEYVV